MTREDKTEAIWFIIISIALICLTLEGIFSIVMFLMKIGFYILSAILVIAAIAIIFKNNNTNNNKQ